MLPFQLFLKFSYIFKAFLSPKLQQIVKMDYGNFKLDLLNRFFDLQAVLSVTECIRCIIFKWVKNTNPNSP